MKYNRLFSITSRCKKIRNRPSSTNGLNVFHQNFVAKKLKNNRWFLWVCILDHRIQWPIFSIFCQNISLVLVNLRIAGNNLSGFFFARESSYNVIFKKSRGFLYFFLSSIFLSIIHKQVNVSWCISNIPFYFTFFYFYYIL